MSKRKDITEFITVTRTEDGRVRATVVLPNTDPRVAHDSGISFEIVRNTYDECIAEWRKFDGWMENR
jgi:hypothetical protein